MVPHLLSLYHNFYCRVHTKSRYRLNTVSVALTALQRTHAVPFPIQGPNTSHPSSTTIKLYRTGYPASFEKKMAHSSCISSLRQKVTASSWSTLEVLHSPPKERPGRTMQYDGICRIEPLCCWTPAWLEYFRVSAFIHLQHPGQSFKGDDTFLISNILTSAQPSLLRLPIRITERR